MITNNEKRNLSRNRIRRVLRINKDDDRLIKLRIANKTTKGKKFSEKNKNLEIDAKIYIF